MQKNVVEKCLLGLNALLDDVKPGFITKDRFDMIKKTKSSLKSKLIEN